MFGFVFILYICDAKHATFIYCSAFAAVYTVSMISCLPLFGEPSGIHVHWYFVGAVCDFLGTSNVVVSHEEEPRCVEWVEEAKSLDIYACTRDPDEHGLMTSTQYEAAFTAKGFAGMETTLFDLFPSDLHAALRRIVSAPNTS